MDMLFLLLFILLPTLYLICFPLLKWSYGCGWVVGITQNHHFLILFYFLLLFFLFFFGGWDEGGGGRHKKWEKKKIFTPIFNRFGLCVDKAIFFKSRINKMNLSQTTSEFTIITHILIHRNCQKKNHLPTPQLNQQIKKIHPP